MYLDDSNLLSVADAIALIDALPVPIRGPRLLDDLRADRDYPPFNKSLMDGYAIRAADASVPLQVIGETAAGESPAPEVGPNQAVAVMTGAPIPPGADAVVPIERTDSPNDFVAAGGQIRV